MFSSLNQKSFYSFMRYSKKKIVFFLNYEVHVKVPVDGFNICRISQVEILMKRCWLD